MADTEVSVVVDEEFRALIPPLRPDELAGLEESVKRDGCRDALVVWAETGILVDGHNRIDICQQHGIEYRTVAMSFGSREAAMLWVIANQLGRRNLEPFQRCELVARGEAIEADKARERLATGGPGIYGGKPLPQISSEAVATSPQDRETRTVMARRAGVSHDTYAKAKVLSESRRLSAG